jgi:hypothetical protein
MSAYLPSYSQAVAGAASTSAGTATTLIAAPSEGAICIASLQLGRTDAGASAQTVALNDPSTTVFVLPPQADGGGIRDIVFDAPIVMPAKTALTFQVNSAVNAVFASAQGYLRE